MISKLKAMGYSVIYVAAMIFFQALSLILTELYGTLTHSSYFSAQENQFAIIALSDLLAVLFIYLLLFARNKLPDIKANFAGAGKGPIFVSLIAGIALSGSISLLMTLIMQSGLFAEYFKRYNEMLSGIDLQKYFVLQSLMLWIIIPIMEEIIFRGYILGELRRAFDPLWAVVIQAALFALVHFDPVQSTYTFAAAIFFGFVYVKTGKLTITVLMHAAFNMAGTGAVFIGDDYAVSVLVITCVPLLAVSLAYFYKYGKMRRTVGGGSGI